MTIDPQTLSQYRVAALELIASIRAAYPELSPDSLSVLCYITALEMQATEGFASTLQDSDFVDLACEQVVGLADDYQAMCPVRTFVLNESDAVH